MTKTHIYGEGMKCLAFVAKPDKVAYSAYTTPHLVFQIITAFTGTG